MRIIQAATGAAVAGAMLLTATSAYAGNTATLRTSSTQVYQGGKVYLQARCSSGSYRPVLVSSLFAAKVNWGRATGRPYNVEVEVSKTKTPTTYAVKFGCVAYVKGAWKISGTQTVNVTVLKVTSSTTAAQIAASGGKPSGTVCAVIETGFGGMAAEVANHHPVGQSLRGCRSEGLCVFWRAQPFAASGLRGIWPSAAFSRSRFTEDTAAKAGIVSVAVHVEVDCHMIDYQPYAALTDRELANLQGVLYAATEQAFLVGNPEFHKDMARVFLEAGYAMLHRLCGDHAMVA